MYLSINLYEINNSSLDRGYLILSRHEFNKCPALCSIRSLTISKIIPFNVF